MRKPKIPTLLLTLSSYHIFPTDPTGQPRRNHEGAGAESGIVVQRVCVIWSRRDLP